MQCICVAVEYTAGRCGDGNRTPESVVVRRGRPNDGGLVTPRRSPSIHRRRDVGDVSESTDSGSDLATLSGCHMLVSLISHANATGDPSPEDAVEVRGRAK
jgi:hypothetical protein